MTDTKELAQYLRDQANGPGLTIFDPTKLMEAADRLELLHEAATYYRFAGTPAGHVFLKRRGWVFNPRAGKWLPPEELELAVGCHK